MCKALGRWERAEPRWGCTGGDPDRGVTSVVRAPLPPWSCPDGRVSPVAQKRARAPGRHVGGLLPSRGAELLPQRLLFSEEIIPQHLHQASSFLRVLFIFSCLRPQSSSVGRRGKEGSLPRPASLGPEPEGGLRGPQRDPAAPAGCSQTASGVPGPSSGPAGTPEPMCPCVARGDPWPRNGLQGAEWGSGWVASTVPQPQKGRGGGI